MVRKTSKLNLAFPAVGKLSVARWWVALPAIVWFGCQEASDKGDQDQPIEPAPGFFREAPDGGPNAVPGKIPDHTEDNSEVVAEIVTEAGSVVRFIDEKLPGDSSIGIIEVGRRSMFTPLIAEGATALEVFSHLAARDVPVPDRLLHDHAVLAELGEVDAVPREFLVPRVYPVEEEDDWGEHCANAGWISGFDAWSTAAPDPQRAHIMEMEDEYTEYGYLSIYRKIWAGACFEEYGTTNSLAVWMENKISGTWTVSVSSRLYIEESERYLYYKFSSVCIYERRIGSHDYGGTGDVWHMSGAWDVYDDCEV